MDAGRERDAGMKGGERDEPILGVNRASRQEPEPGARLWILAEQNLLCRRDRCRVRLRPDWRAELLRWLRREASRGTCGVFEATRMSEALLPFHFQRARERIVAEVVERWRSTLARLWLKLAASAWRPPGEPKMDGRRRRRSRETAVGWMLRDSERCFPASVASSSKMAGISNGGGRGFIGGGLLWTRRTATRQRHRRLGFCSEVRWMKSTAPLQSRELVLWQDIFRPCFAVRRKRRPDWIATPCSCQPFKPEVSR